MNVEIYEPLWHILESQGHNKAWLRQNGIHANTINKLINGKNVTLDTLIKICILLNCTLADIIEVNRRW